MAGKCLDNRGSKLEASKGVRNPSVPIAKAVTGGSAVSWRNSDAVCSTVPSPPRVTQKSGISAAAASVLLLLGGALSEHRTFCLWLSAGVTAFESVHT